VKLPRQANNQHLSPLGRGRRVALHAAGEGKQPAQPQLLKVSTQRKVGRNQQSTSYRHSNTDESTDADEFRRVQTQSGEYHQRFQANGKAAHQISGFENEISGCGSQAVSVILYRSVTPAPDRAAFHSSTR
jgi:hypothetical protein